MSIDQDRGKEAAVIRELIDGFVRAIRARDLDGVMAVFSPEVVSFDLAPPLQHGGGDAFRERWQELFDSYETPIQYEIRNLAVMAAAADVAFSHSLNRIRGRMQNGRT